MSQPQYVTPELRRRNIQIIIGRTGNTMIRTDMIIMITFGSQRVWLAATSAMLPSTAGIRQVVVLAGTKLTFPRFPDIALAGPGTGLQSLMYLRTSSGSEALMSHSPLMVPGFKPRRNPKP